ncbi:MAG: hypothetical protein HFJ51_04715 [Clostridia bacterium]|nr:hypothetical protein [Clostridia bacterium]
MQKDIYDYISIVNVINQLNLKKTYIKGNYIYAICPFCQRENEKNGYLKINTIKDVYICKNCEESGSSIELYAKLNFISTKEAFKRILRETPILEDRPYIYNNPIKDEMYRDIIYREFLKLQTLNNTHYNKLKAMNLTDEYIKENHFKTIENNPYKKKKICQKLQEQGLKLDGIPGMFQDIDFKWTYKSHNGIFIPVVFNNKIQGLRILLDDEYKLDTENIWFSSNNEHNGTKASNWPMILKEENSNWINMYNANETQSIIIATEMILAHKLFNNTHKTVIGIPNSVDKEVVLNIAKRMNVDKVFLYVDKCSLLHSNMAIFSNIINTLEEQNIKIDFRIALSEKDIGKELNEYKEEKRRIA